MILNTFSSVVLYISMNSMLLFYFYKLYLKAMPNVQQFLNIVNSWLVT